MSNKVCIIGAGSSGIVAAKTLKQHNIPFDCFEMGSDIGGNWRYGNDNGRSSAYKSLHIDTSKEKMQFSDYPMPESYPNFPHHTHIIEYFADYVAHFGLRPHITFRTQVVDVSRHGDEWRVLTRNVDDGSEATQTYRAVLVCNGHHWHPRMPEIPGRFDGEITHSHYYREPHAYRGKKVLVLGIGNSGTDLACELSHVAEKVYLASRRSAHIIPRYIMGKPTDKWASEASSYLPFWLQRALYGLVLRLGVGDQEAYGVKRPDHKLLSEHPTMSADLLNLVGLGEIEMKPNLRELCGDHVGFVDGTEADVDVIFYATGYKIRFPFLDESILNPAGNHVDLYHKVVHPDYPASTSSVSFNRSALSCRWRKCSPNGWRASSMVKNSFRRQNR